MAENFAFDAPQYFDFSKDLGNEDSACAEAYFDIDHEGNTMSCYMLANDQSKYFSPATESDVTEQSCEASKFVLRKSISLGALPINREEAENDKHEPALNNTLQNGNTVAAGNEVLNTQTENSTKNRTTNGALPTKGTFKTRDSNLRKSRIIRSEENVYTNRYVSMAEAVNKFQQSTPTRFRSKPKTEVFHISRGKSPTFTTIPHSPALATKQRVRTVHIPSTEEQELKAFEDAKKYKIKARPLNNKILGPMKPTAILKKPPTVPQPFNITQQPVKKLAGATPPRAQFHANPIPKSVLAPPKQIVRNSIITHPVTPKLSKRLDYVDHRKLETSTLPNANSISNISDIGSKLAKTTIKPFSFEERDKKLLKRKEELIAKVMEQEKKAREFHARPIPKTIFKVSQTKTNTTQEVRQSVINFSTKGAEEAEMTMFKAKPANVLYKKPFEPKKEEKILTEIQEFNLNTERRIREREQFEQQKKEKEERSAELKKQMEEQLLRCEQAEIARLRKVAEHKANPIRHYKEVQPAPLKKLTKPLSPKFISNKKGNKENECQ